MNRAVFLDRDGVINKERHEYVKSWEEFEFLPNSIKALKLLSKTDYKIIIVTNQAGIARGYYTEGILNDIHEKMLNELSKNNVRIDAIKYCPHKEEDDCKCRKPKSTLILSATNEFDIDLNKSWLIGDKTKDIKTVENIKEMGHNIKTILVMTGYAGKDGIYNVKPDYYAEDLMEAVNIIRKHNS
jgi:D,D-heptose 1,7-bisphosphate phosphatase